VSADRDALDNRQKLAQLGYQYADIIENGGGTIGAGIVRRLADAVLGHPQPTTDHPAACRRCGTGIVQKPTGRPEVFGQVVVGGGRRLRARRA
jgi:hypothetical protein